MAKSFIPIVFFFQVLFWYPTYSQTGTEAFPRGGRSMGMGNANVTIGDAWSIFNNIGGLAKTENSQVTFSYDHRLNLDELTTLAAGAVFKGKNKAFGLGISSFGSEHFSQNQIGLGFSNQLGIASLGIKVNYLQTSIEGFGRGVAAVIEFGGVAELTPQLFFGAHIYNITRAKYGKNSDDRLPTTIKAGISYRPNSKVMVNLEAEKDILLDPLLKMGLEYNLMDRIWGRVGMNTDPNKFFFGVGFRPKRFHFDYAMTQHQNLGLTHHFSFNYLFLRK
jgi:opacity protein-like surface antigen